MNNKKICKKCLNTIDKNSKMCPHCFTRQETKLERYGKIVAIVLGCLIYFFIMGYIILEAEFVDSENQNTEESSPTSVESTKKEEIQKKPEKTEEELRDEKIAEYKEKCETYNYKDIFRFAEDYEGKYAKFTGEVIQITEATTLFSKEKYHLRIDITKNEYGYYEDTIFVEYTPMIGATRILEEDIVTVYGILDGLKTYTTVLGSETTLPKLNSSYIIVSNS